MMWRTPLSVLLSAILGGAVATAIYTFFGWILERGTVPSTLEELKMGMVVFVAASWFTVPGAILLSAVEFALSLRVRSDRALDGAIVVFGSIAGSAFLGGLNLQDAPLFALLDGFYGLTTAMLFVLFQRQLGSRRARRL